VRSAERQQQRSHARFQAEAMSPKAYKTRVSSALKQFMPLFGQRPLVGITRIELRRFSDRWLTEGRDPGSLNRILWSLSAVWRWAQETGLIAEAADSPVRGLFQARPQGSLDFLSAEEVERLLLHAERNAPALYPMIATAVYTGSRVTRWDQRTTQASQLASVRAGFMP
jgi:integrase